MNDHDGERTYSDSCISLQQNAHGSPARSGSLRKMRGCSRAPSPAKIPHAARIIAPLSLPIDHGNHARDWHRRMTSNVITLKWGKTPRHQHTKCIRSCLGADGVGLGCMAEAALQNSIVHPVREDHREGMRESKPLTYHKLCGLRLSIASSRCWEKLQDTKVALTRPSQALNTRERRDSRGGAKDHDTTGRSLQPLDITRFLSRFPSALTSFTSRSSTSGWQGLRTTMIVIQNLFASVEKQANHILRGLDWLAEHHHR